MVKSVAFWELQDMVTSLILSPLWAKVYKQHNFPVWYRKGKLLNTHTNTPSVSHLETFRHPPLKSERKPLLLPSPPGISPLYLFPFVSNAFVNSSTKVKANNPLQTLGVTATSMNPSQLSSPAAHSSSGLLSLTTMSTKDWNPPNN